MSYNHTMNIISMMLFYIIFIYSPAVITLNKKYFLTVTFLILIGIIFSSLYYYDNKKIYINMAGLFFGSVDILAIAIVIVYVTTKKIKTNDDIYASIIVFFLIGGTFSDIYYLLNTLDPKSLHFAFTNTGFIQVANVDIYRKLIDYNQFLYFSFSTITTLGYGDIVPLSSLAKRLASVEACIGVLYIAIFIGRLIGAGYSLNNPRNYKELKK